MKIGILGTRGIPNHYGGFEQFAEYLSAFLAGQPDISVSVYNSHTHPYQESEWNGVQLIHCKDPEDQLGTAGQFLYDLNCIRDARKRNFDIVLQLGYTSSSVWGKLLPKSAVIITNMDGLEWKRTKFSKPVQRFIKFAERLGVKTSDFLIADSVGIQEHLLKTYKVPSAYIPYGAHIFDTPDSSYLQEYGVNAYAYDMLVARLEPENSIEVILEGVEKANLTRSFLVVGKHETTYGAYLKERFKNCKQIRFLGGIYNIHALNNVRYFSNVYFHGHTVGGTNPSLLEAMASASLICANDNIFNRAILEEDALYFTSASDVEEVLKSIIKETQEQQQKVRANLDKIKKLYSWDLINQKYLDFMNNCYAQK